MKAIIGSALCAVALAAAPTQTRADASYLDVRVGAARTSADALPGGEDGSSYGPWAGYGVAGSADFDYASDSGVFVGGGLRLSVVRGADDPDRLQVVDVTAARLPVTIGWRVGGDDALAVRVGAEVGLAFLWLTARDDAADFEEAGGAVGAGAGPFIAVDVSLSERLDLSMRATGLFTVAPAISDVVRGGWEDALVTGLDVPIEVGIRWAL